MSSQLTLTGGAYSISADFAALGRFAGQLAAASQSLADAAVRIVRTGLEADWSTETLLDPSGAGEVALRTASSAPCCAAAAAELGALAGALAAAKLAYERADEARRQLVPELTGLLNLPRVLVDLAAAPVDLLSGHPAGLQRMVVDDPDLINLIPDALQAAVQVPFTGQHSTVISPLAGLAARGYHNGTPSVTAIGSAQVDDDNGAPRTVGDLLRGLALRDAGMLPTSATTAGGGGFIDVRFVTQPAAAEPDPAGPGGPASAPRAVIVDLPGTTRWNVNPFERTKQATDFATNLRAFAGEPSVYGQGVILALEAAGVKPDEPIMLVGHSEGGLVAMQLASQLQGSGRFTVTHVVTAGAPVGNAKPPAGVSVLSVENRGDIVPQLDGVDNPDQPNWITATVDEAEPTVATEHSVQAYLAAGEQLDESADRSLLAWREGAAPFLDGSSVSTAVYQVQRQ